MGQGQRKRHLHIFLVNGEWITGELSKYQDLPTSNRWLLDTPHPLAEAISRHLGMEGPGMENVGEFLRDTSNTCNGVSGLQFPVVKA